MGTYLKRTSHSPERSRIQSRYLSICKNTSWQLLLISVCKTYTINKNSTDSHYNASFLRRIWINLTMANFYTFLVAYSKVGQLYKLSYQCRNFGFRIWQKSYSTISKVILESFCKNFFHYRSRKTVEIFDDRPKSIINFWIFFTFYIFYICTFFTYFCIEHFLISFTFWIFFGIFQIKMSLLAQNIYHIFPCALVYTKDHHAKLYQMLWTNLEEDSCHF